MLWRYLTQNKCLQWGKGQKAADTLDEWIFILFFEVSSLGEMFILYGSTCSSAKMPKGHQGCNLQGNLLTTDREGKAHGKFESLDNTEVGEEDRANHTSV